jgi:hypothetical protein
MGKKEQTMHKNFNIFGRILLISEKMKKTKI